MDSSLSPREIQARLRNGASLAEVAQEAGVCAEAIEGFACPVLAEREFMASSALATTIRRRGESSYRKLGELITERLRQRGVDADEILWDAWRQEDLRWRVRGILIDDAGEREADFIYDPKARFSVADNADARWMIGEALPGASSEEENTVDFDDELALIRATSEQNSAALALPGDEVPAPEIMHDDIEDTSSLDALYDMLSGVSEDSVRIYTGLDLRENSDEEVETRSARSNERSSSDSSEFSSPDTLDIEFDDSEERPLKNLGSSAPEESSSEKPAEAGRKQQKSEQKPAAKKKKRGRAQVPTWDEIMFGGPHF